MKDVALFLAGAGASLAACFYVLLHRSRDQALSDWADGDWPAVPSDLKASHSPSIVPEAQQDHV